MEKREKIRRIYSIVIGAFAVAMGVAFICVAADIYYSGRGTGTIYTREIVGERLTALAIPCVILIGAILCGLIFPLYEVRAKRRSEDSLRLLSKRKPTGGEGEAYEAAERAYEKLKKTRYIVWGCALAVTLASAIAALCYLLNTAHFKGENITGEVFRMVQNVLPWVVVAFAVLIAATVVNGVLARRQFEELKKLIKCGNGIPQEHSEPQAIAKLKKVAASDLTLWIVRGIVFVVGVTFILLGIVNGGARDVMIKAVNICTECIGLG